MADSITPNLGLTQPEVGQSFNTWGGKLNADLLIIDGTYNPQKGPSLPVSGTSAAAPGLDFAGDTNTGIWSPGADQISITLGGTDRLSMTTSLVTLAVATTVSAGLSFNNDVQNLSDGTTPVYRLLRYTEFVANGTFTKDIKSRLIEVEVIASGACGSGVTGGGAGTANCAPGGGGGETRRAAYLTADVASSVTITVGAGVTATTGAGTAGNNSSFGTQIVSNGGGAPQAGLTSATFVIRNGGDGGTGGSTTGTPVWQIQKNGGTGGDGIVLSGATGKAGFGGDANGAGGGAPPAANSTNAGNPGTSYGTGGSGGSVAAASAAARGGGNSPSGIIRIWEWA